MLLSATILLLIILPLLLSLALSLHTVQSYVANHLTRVASEKIGSRIEIGGIHYTMPNDLIFTDLLIEDMKQDTMLFTSKATARISALSLFKKELIVSRVTLSDSQVNLREMYEGMLNIKQAVMRITNPEKQSTFRTNIKRIDVSNLDFSLKRLAESKEQYGVDLTDIALLGINGSISNLVSQNKITELSLDSFSAVERSGLTIESLETLLVTYEGVVDLIDFRAATAESRINLPRLRLESDTWEDYKDFNANVSIELLSNHSTLAASDVAYFAPALEGKEFLAKKLSFSANGTVDFLEVQLDNLSFGESSSGAAILSIQGAADLNSAEFNLDVSRLRSSLTDINTTIVGMGGKSLMGKTRQIVSTLGTIDMVATLDGSLSDMKVDARATTRQGSVNYHGVVKNATSRAQIAGTVKSKGVNLGTLLDNKSLGTIDLESRVSYAKLAKGIESKAEGRISQIGYNSNNFHAIDFVATCSGEHIEGAIASHDPKLNFDLTAVVDLDDDPHYDVNVRVNNADMKALALNKRDSISRFSGSIKVNMGGRSLDDLNGQITLRNINYKYNDKSVYEPMIAVNARNRRDSKYIALDSDFLTVRYNSKSSYDALYSYIKDGLREYIPLLYTSRTERNKSKNITLADNYSTLSISFKNFKNIADAISSGLNVADNTSFNMMVNPFSERFSLRLNSDYLEHNDLAVTGLNINASNDKDSLSLYATAADLFMGRNSLSSATLMAGARNNVVELSTGFRDSLASMSATLGMRVKFDSVQRANISLLPSQISMDEQMWMVSADEIVGNGSSLHVDNFAMVNGTQRLELDGIISKEPSDSLTLTLNNYDISMITSVVNNLGYSIDGLSNGYVHIYELLGKTRVVADVKLDDVEVNSIPSPPLDLSANWDAKESRARVEVNNRNNSETVATGYYAPSSRRYYANLKVDSLNMGLIDPLLKTTITGTKGYANVDVALQGQNNTASLNGTIDVYDLSTKILYTQVEYLVPSARIDVKDNQLSSFARTMFDADGNQGLITLNLSLNRLSNVSYNLRIVPDNMLVLNTTVADNELFYGKLYASGVATIKGDKRGVNIDITATSEPNSNFFMPLSTKSTVASTDFITFVQPNKAEESSATTNYRRTFVKERNERLNAQTTTNLDINMALHATPDLDFQLVIDPVVGDIIRGRGEGRLNLNIAPQSNIFEMYGDYNITEGNYLFTLLNPISKRFVIESGSSIQWTGDPINPTLDIDAVYKVKTSLDPLISGTSSSSGDDSSSSRSVPVDCIIHLGDKLLQPSVDFSIDVPTADTEQQAVISNTLIDQETISQQFFYLMIANSFIPVTTSYGSGLSGSTASSTGFELLTNQLSNWLSTTNYDIDIRYRPGSDDSSDEVDLGISRGLIDNRLLIEVEGNYLSDNTTMTEENFSNFMGEAYITWLIDKAGALRLKGFTQTIDRYDENQGLQETGVGVYYSESFNDLKELKQKVLNRFRRKKKQE